MGSSIEKYKARSLYRCVRPAYKLPNYVITDLRNLDMRQQDEVTFNGRIWGDGGFKRIVVHYSSIANYGYLASIDDLVRLDVGLAKIEQFIPEDKERVGLFLRMVDSNAPYSLVYDMDEMDRFLSDHKIEGEEWVAV